MQAPQKNVPVYFKMFLTTSMETNPEQPVVGGPGLAILAVHNHLSIAKCTFCWQKPWFKPLK
jgi:hypothetical protein